MCHEMYVPSMKVFEDFSSRDGGLESNISNAKISSSGPEIL